MRQCSPLKIFYFFVLRNWCRVRIAPLSPVFDRSAESERCITTDATTSSLAPFSFRYALRSIFFLSLLSLSIWRWSFSQSVSVSWLKYPTSFNIVSMLPTRRLCRLSNWNGINRISRYYFPFLFRRNKLCGQNIGREMKGQNRIIYRHFLFRSQRNKSRSPDQSPQITWTQNKE